MAQDSSKFDLSKLNFFNRLDARSRVFVLLGAVIGFIFLIYLSTRLISGGSQATGPSRIASAPQGLQSVPGGQISPEYQKALQQANAQAAQQARISGGSAVPTMINTGAPGMPQSTGNCNIICSDQNVNVKNNLDDWVKQGKVTPEVATALEELANKNVPVSEYADELNRLVKEGKLTPEQARELLEEYKKQHANSLLQDSANAMDGLIKQGQVPLDAANQLLTAQKNGVSVSDYSKQLQQLVNDGKISPAVATQLLAQYSQQRAREVVNQSIAILHQMARAGQITPDVEKDLVDLENRMVPIDTYNAKLQQFLTAGKLTPAVADKILNEYKSQKAAIGPVGSLNQLVSQAENDAYQEISDLLNAGKISPEVASQLTDMMQRNVSMNEFQAAVNQLVQQNKLTPDIAKLKIADYLKTTCYKTMVQHLSTLQGNNATPAVYADELKRGVATCNLPPEQAAQLLQEYQATTAIPASSGVTVAGTPEYQQLQQRLQQASAATQTASASPAEFATAQAQAEQESAADRQTRIDALMSSMSGQASQLVNAWQPETMVYRSGTAESDLEAAKKKESEGTTTTTTTSSSKAGAATATTPGEGGAPIIKAGTIVFGVLDTAVNSDYPDSPVMVTIVQGKFKGAKMLGKVATAKNVAGQLDRVSLNFTIMNMDMWPKTKTITAYAIDPDTARTVLASSVDNHYLKKYGAMMATAFLQGYSTSITQAGTSTTGIFGTSTSHPNLSPGNKLAVAFGQIGQNLGTMTQSWSNIPPTVKVESGVGLGILFMNDVT